MAGLSSIRQLVTLPRGAMAEIEQLLGLAPGVPAAPGVSRVA